MRIKRLLRAPMSEATKDEWDRSSEVQARGARSDTGLMIIELRKYNSATELLIGSQSAGSPGQDTLDAGIGYPSVLGGPAL